jgi:hypothetical protein
MQCMLSSLNRHAHCCSCTWPLHQVHLRTHAIQLLIATTSLLAAAAVVIHARTTGDELGAVSAVGAAVGASLQRYCTLPATAVLSAALLPQPNPMQWISMQQLQVSHPVKRYNGKRTVK